MKTYKKSKLFGNILSDGSLTFLVLSSFQSQKSLNSKKIDMFNHPVWTGKRPKEQTEISNFIGRLKKGKDKNFFK
uniref:ribosomal protein L31 n=1 Tax=Hapterophycus canaliculatus TaxID=2567908 RepID=UPI002E7A0BC9|nr:ribosomal protein L31 [Hapterophycus canaliculatus]WBP70181.1 ribosomal protein L31 [Hapterophycus canaliculatus]